MGKLRSPSYSKILALGFLLLIVLGTLLLCLPVSSRTGEWTNPLHAWFTSTSATCVTGLVMFDTCTHWTLFGQIVILCLIQVGGLGFMTIISMFSIFMRRHIGLRERRLLMQSSGNMRHDGVIRLMKHIIEGTVLIELIGAALLSIRFVPQMGVAEGIYYGVFHSVSAFCNAGFDLMGKNQPFSSFTAYSGDWLVCGTLMLLIIIGGLGFLVWEDIWRNKWHFRKYSLHAKLVLTMSAFLILVGAVVFFFAEENSSMSGMPTGQRILASLFQSVTTRTAGFNSVDQNKLGGAGSIMTMVLMFIGGSPASTAGGIKTTTVIVVLLTAWCTAKNEKYVTVYKRRIDEAIAKQALTILMIYLIAVITAAAVIGAVESFNLRQIFYEVVSAVGTVGLTTGITSSLKTASEIVIGCLMYFGRIGGLTLVLVITERKSKIPLERPVEKILIG